MRASVFNSLNYIRRAKSLSERNLFGAQSTTALCHILIDITRCCWFCFCHHTTTTAAANIFLLLLNINCSLDSWWCISRAIVYDDA